MREGRVLGFPNVLAPVALLLSGLLIAFVLIRRKWRLAVARRDKVKWLLAMTAEETKKVELEAAASYYDHGDGNEFEHASVSESEFVSPPVPYQCAVCSSPTSSRCAQCKSVWYCSGKCQITDWRKGHKDRCLLLTVTHKVNSAESCSMQDVIKPEEYDSNSGRHQFEGRGYIKLVETSSDWPPISTFACGVLDMKNEPGIKHFRDDDDEGTMSTSEVKKKSFSGEFTGFTATGRESSISASSNNRIRSDKSGLQQPVNVSPDHNYTDMERTRSKKVSNQPEIDNAADVLCHFENCSKIKPSFIEGESPCGSPVHSHFEPSTPSLDFWEGTMNSSSMKIDGEDDSSPSKSTEATFSSMSTPQSNVMSDTVHDMAAPVGEEFSSTNIISADNSHQAAEKIENLINLAAVSEEIRKENQKNKKVMQSSSETSHMDNETCHSRHTSREIKSFSVRGPCASRVSDDGECPSSIYISKLCLDSSLGSEGLNRMVKGKTSSSLAPKPGEAGNLVSSNGLESSSKLNYFLQTGKSAHADRMDGIESCSPRPSSCHYNTNNGFKNSVWKVVDHLRPPKLSRNTLVGAGNDNARKHNSEVLFSYDMFVKLYKWNLFELHPCGLKNCGNSCYANSVLQCLAFTPPLTAYLLQGLHSKTCDKKEWCFMCEFESLVLKAKEGKSPLSPFGILSQIQMIGSQLSNGRQEDAHEFLRYAIDTMQAVCLKEARRNTSGFAEEETTLIGLTFGGYLHSKIKCMKCGGKSERHERMMDLTVEIDGDIRTLEEALCQFTGTEILDGENKYECSRCQSYEKAKKTLAVLEAPNILTIALKRFQSGKFGKLNKAIEFPEILDIAKFISGTNDNSPIYRLYGVVVHLDFMNASVSGHYVCYVRNIQNKWFMIDDDKVVPVELVDVLQKRAYILLYARCFPRAPRVKTESILPNNHVKQNCRTLKSRLSSVCPSNLPVPECYSVNDSSVRPMRPITEEDSSSSTSIFSEAGSCSTESSKWDSTSIEEFVDQIFGDTGNNWNSWRMSSDSDSSSSSPPSPVYPGCSPLVSQADDVKLDADKHDFWERPFNKLGNQVLPSERKGSSSTLHHNSTKQHKRSASTSSRGNMSDKLGWTSPLNHLKSSLLFRRSTRERRD